MENVIKELDELYMRKQNEHEELEEKFRDLESRNFELRQELDELEDIIEAVTRILNK